MSDSTNEIKDLIDKLLITSYFSERDIIPEFANEVCDSLLKNLATNIDKTDIDNIVTDNFLNTKREEVYDKISRSLKIISELRNYFMHCAADRDKYEGSIAHYKSDGKFQARVNTFLNDLYKKIQEYHYDIQSTRAVLIEQDVRNRAAENTADWNDYINEINEKFENSNEKLENIEKNLEEIKTRLDTEEESIQQALESAEKAKNEAAEASKQVALMRRKAESALRRARNAANNAENAAENADEAANKSLEESKNILPNLLTIIGIFVAIIIAIVAVYMTSLIGGNAHSLYAIFSMKSIPARLALLFGLGLFAFDLLFAFLYAIAKLTGRSIAASSCFTNTPTKAIGKIFDKYWNYIILNVVAIVAIIVFSVMAYHSIWTVPDGFDEGTKPTPSPTCFAEISN